MKKTLTLLIVTALSVCALFAQEKKHYWGIKTGLNLSSLTYADETSGMKPGVNAGVFADLFINRTLFFQPGLEYSMKGGRFSEDFYDKKYKSNARMHFIELPAQFGAAFRLRDKARLMVTTGPYIALGFGKVHSEKKSILVGDIMYVIGAPDLDFGDYLNRFDFGWKFSVGAKFGRIYTGVEYGLGLRNLTKNFYEDASYGEDVRTRNLSINVGYYF